MPEKKTGPLTEGHRGHQGPEVIKKGYQGGEVVIVDVQRPDVSDPRGGTPAQPPSQPQDAGKTSE